MVRSWAYYVINKAWGYSHGKRVRVSERAYHVASRCRAKPRSQDPNQEKGQNPFFIRKQST